MDQIDWTRAKGMLKECIKALILNISFLASPGDISIIDMQDSFF